MPHLIPSGWRVARAVMLAVAITAAAATWVAASSGASAPSPTTASITDKAGDYSPSFGPPPTDVTHVDIGWDGAALKVTLTYARQPDSYAFSLSMTDRAMTDVQVIDGACNDPTGVSIRVGTSANWQYDLEPQPSAVLAVTGVQGNAYSTSAVANGDTATYSFTNASLTAWLARHDPFVCVSGTADGDAFFGVFAGKALSLTSSGATTVLSNALAAKFGGSFTHATTTWVRCPDSEISPPAVSGDTFTATCRFAFRTGKSLAEGATQMALKSGVAAPSGTLIAVTGSTDLRNCAIPSQRRGWANGVWLSNRNLMNSGTLGQGRRCAWLVGPAGMAADIESDVAARAGRPLAREVVGLHGTNLAGFEDIATFPCAVSHRKTNYRFDCRNKLGERFVYSFNLHR
jgi:hypothetical protein